MEGAVSKQYLLLAGVPILVHTLKVFQESPLIDEIVLVVPQTDLAKAGEIVSGYGLSKVARVVAGGKERQDSVENGLQAVDDGYDIVVIHDAVRPFITGELIRLAVEGAIEHAAIAIGVPAKDTIKRVDHGETVCETLSRDCLWHVQTPQAFQRHLIKRAYEKARADHFIGTDDAVLVERLGVKVKMIRGSYDNIKITTQDDLRIAEALAGRRQEREGPMRTGFGYDSHRLVKDRPLILGGVEIPYGKGLLGHSDADVVLHAVCDALIGAVGAGDIGLHFPDTDPALKGISSLSLLDRVAALVKERGFSIHNLDVTVVLEEPKMRAYAERMVLNLSRCLSIPPERINIKAKTNEGMGFVGRGEGIAAFAVVTVKEQDET